MKTRKLLMSVIKPLYGALPIMALCALSGSVALADPPSGSAYYTDPQHSRVQDATAEGIGVVNMITCFISAMKPDALVNQGEYIALIDEAKCDTDSRSSSSASAETNSSSQAAARYTTAVVDSTRASNSDPMLASIWIDEGEEGRNATIFAHATATSAPTETNPYGEFRLDYCGRAESASGCAMNGFLEGTESGISYFEIEENEYGSRTKALTLGAANATSGSGRLEIEENGASSAFAFAYDANLYIRSDGSDDQCFSRDASDPDTGVSIWRYGLYDQNTGERIERESGFPIEYSVDGATYRGHLGYWGLSLPPDAAALLSTGDTVTKVDYSSGDSPTRTNYEMLRAGGKLTRFSKHTRTLAGIDGIAFTTYVGSDAETFFTGATQNTQYELYWDDSAGDFKATGQVSCGENGCHTQTFTSAASVSASFWEARGGVQGWSQALGGELFIDLSGIGDPIDSSAVSVAYRSQDLVYPADLPASLHCLRDCPTAASLAAYFTDGSSQPSPFRASTANNWNPTSAGDVVSYSTSTATAMLIDSVDQPVVIANSGAVQNDPRFRWGVTSGRLFTTLADAECSSGSATYCDSRVNTLDVFYQWETGPNSWNQFAAVKDGNDDFVSFDPPLQVSYQVPTGAAYGQYSGSTIILQYGGFGDLWGIPGSCVSSVDNQAVSCDTANARYVPSFTIPFDMTSGRVTSDSATYFVKWLEREIRFAKKDLGVCTAADLTAPVGLTLPTSADLKDPSHSASDVYIGEKPTVSEAPRVIHGEVKY